MSTLKMKKIKVIIMAGGAGTRLWPKSRKNNPKQFSKIINNKTMIEETFERFKQIVSLTNIYVVITAEYKNLLQKSIPNLLEENIILEPSRRDTAAAICYAILSLRAADDDILFFVPSDHYVSDLPKFYQTLEKAYQITETKNNMTLIGITPSSPATNYGYIKIKEEAKNKLVEEFVEKPNLEKAITYLANKQYYWNSGMFFFKKKYILEQYQKHAKQHYQMTKECLTITDTNLQKELYEKINPISFDYAVVEKLQNIYFVNANFIWSDIGSWNALSEIQNNLSEKEENQHLMNCKNVIYNHANKKKFFAYQCNNITAECDEKDLTIVLNSLKDINLILDKKVLYITDKKQEVLIKDILKKLDDFKEDII